MGPLFFALVALFQTPQVEDLSWMGGYWLDCSGGTEVSETWSDPRAGLMVGHSVTTRAGRSRFELAHIRYLPDGAIAYVAQPGGLPPTIFKVQEIGPDRVVFANPENDFPHRIIYQRHKDQLQARIEGADEDETRSAQWTFNKAELNSRCPS